MNQSNLEIQIDQLILPDLPPRQRARVAAAIEQELAKLWQERGKPAGFVGASLALAATEVAVAAGSTPEGIGQQVAQMIYGQMGEIRPKPLTFSNPQLRDKQPDK